MNEIDEDLRVLISKMLTLDPRERWTVQDCLASRYFDDIRSIPHQKQSSFQLNLNIDCLGVYDYKQQRNVKYTRAET